MDMEGLRIMFWTHLALNILFVLEMEDSHPMEGQFTTSNAKQLRVHLLLIFHVFKLIFLQLIITGVMSYTIQL